jgi:hypothetical protein
VPFPGSKISENPFLIAPIIIHDEIIVNSSPKCGYGRLAMKGPLVAATAS